MVGEREGTAARQAWRRRPTLARMRAAARPARRLLRCCASSAAAPAVARARARVGARVLDFNAAGVSFDDRQALLASLAPGDGAYLQREPRNPADPGAVAVRGVDGRCLGYVPRGETDGACDGRAAVAVVQFVGRKGGGAGGGGGEGGRGGGGDPPSAADAPSAAVPAGLRLRAWPALRPLLVEALPRRVRGARGSLAALLPDADWARLRGEAVAAARGRCEVTGSEPPALEAIEAWDLDPLARVATLLGLAAVDPAVAAVARGALRAAAGDAGGGAPPSPASPTPSPAILATIALVNGWSRDEARAHVAAAAAVAAAADADAERWTVDAAWLEARGVRVPGEWDEAETGGG